jgi:hypothetical protein
MDALEPACLGEQEALRSQPIDGLALVLEGLGGNDGHPFAEILARLFFQAGEELPLHLSVVSTHARRSSHATGPESRLY